jgi:hypothetical protein
MTATVPEALDSTRTESPDLIIRPGLPPYGGIFDLPAQETPIAAHQPHGPYTHIAEHLHDHLPHMHISYGFSIPEHRPEQLPESTHLEVAMAISRAHRVDCNPIFIGRMNGNAGETLKIGDEDVHWIHSEETAEKATERFAATGRKLPDDMYFSGFVTATVDEREDRPYTREELAKAIGSGLIAEQHFQATWMEPKDEAIEPYDVTIYLGNTATPYHTFFRLPTVVPLGAFQGIPA